MIKYIYVVGDTHNIKSLKIILERFDNIISLGDIAAVSKNIFKDENLSRYKKVWKLFSKNKYIINKNDIGWFKKINTNSWIKQISNIKNSNKNFILNIGNSDLAMINFFPECKNYLKKSTNNKFKIIQKPEIKNFGKNIQIIFLPYQKKKYNLDKILDKIHPDKKMFIIAHCPPIENTNKEYYKHNYDSIKKISKRYKQKIICLHGHMHPSFSYIYNLSSLPKVVFLCPKAEENLNGFGINNHVIRIETLEGKVKLFDSLTNKEVSFQDLPKEYLNNQCHWNNFKKT